jgi:hypothetical protein
MLIGAGIALAWTINGAWLARALDRHGDATAQDAPASPEDAP